jgi:hypothetical protein
LQKLLGHATKDNKVPKSKNRSPSKLSNQPVIKVQNLYKDYQEEEK